jgi:hypothetical protein
MGALSGGMRLSSDECELLLEIMSGERKLPLRRGRPRVDKTAFIRRGRIADFVELLEADGWSPDAAVERAVEVYGVARRTVFTAKKKRQEQLVRFKPKGCSMTPVQRQNLIKSYERAAAEGCN